MNYVYEIYNPKTSEVIYVGQTKNPNKRWKNHTQVNREHYREKKQYIKDNGCLMRIVFWSKDKKEVDEQEGAFALKAFKNSSIVFMRQPGTKPFSDYSLWSEAQKAVAIRNKIFQEKNKKVFYDTDGNKYVGIKETARMMGMDNKSVRQSLKSNGRLKCKDRYFTFVNPLGVPNE